MNSTGLISLHECSTVEELIDFGVLSLRVSGLNTARLDTEILLATVLKCDRAHLFTQACFRLTESQRTLFANYLIRRSEGEPVAYMTQRKEFYSIEFEVEKGVLVPRPESEHLVEHALDWIRKYRRFSETVRVLDLGSGSGCIGLAIIGLVPSAHLLGIDIDSICMRVAIQNARNLELLNRSQFIVGDAAEITSEEINVYLGGKPDVIVANPPYLDFSDLSVDWRVRKHEPHKALFALKGGLEALEQWLKTASRLLSPGGLCLFEIGHDQGEGVRKIAGNQTSLVSVEILKDLSGYDRILRAVQIDF